MPRIKRCSRASAPGGRGVATRRESNAATGTDTSGHATGQGISSDERPSMRTNLRQARERSRSPAADRQPIRTREPAFQRIGQNRPVNHPQSSQISSPSRRSTRSSNSGSSSQLHSDPVVCPVPNCSLQWIHQHPPCLQYYTPKYDGKAVEVEDDDGYDEEESPFTDADLNGHTPASRDLALPSIENQHTTTTPTAHVSMAGFHEDMETSRMILSGEFEWALPDLGHASSDPSEYQLVPTPQPSTPMRAFLDDVEGLKLDDEPFGTESDCNMDETENEIDNELPSSAMRREPSPYFHGFQLRQSANGVWTGYGEK